MLKISSPKPEDKDYMRADKKGLYLVISPKVTSIEDTLKGSKVKVNPYL